MGCDLFCEMLFHMYLLASATKKKNRTKKIFTTHETNIQRVEKNHVEYCNFLYTLYNAHKS